MFAHAVYVGNQRWNLGETPDILVTLSEELNIILPASQTNPTIYIDVPLDSVLEVSLNTRLVPDPSQPAYRLIMNLDEARINCVINATGYTEHNVAVVFSSEKDANTLNRLLVPTTFRTNGFLPRQRSGATDTTHRSLSADDAPGSALDDSQLQVRTASLANATVPHSDAMSTIDPSKLERVHKSQHTSTEHQEGPLMSIADHDDDLQQFSHVVEMAAEGIDVSQISTLIEHAIEGIDVSQIDGLSPKENHDQNIRASTIGNTSPNAGGRSFQAPSKRVRECVGHIDQTSAAQPLSSYAGFDTTQNRPKFPTRLSQQVVSPVKQAENKISPKDHSEEHDELYHASPKITKGQRKSPRILARDTSQNLERISQSNVHQRSAKTGPPVKPSRQFRHADSVMESQLKQTVDGNLTRLIANGTGDARGSMKDKESKVPGPDKARTVMKKTTERTKRTAQSNEKVTATEEPLDPPLESHRFSTSPRRAESTPQSSGKKKGASARLNITKEQSNKQKKAMPMPKKAAITASFKGSAPLLREDSKIKAKAKASGSIRDSVTNGSKDKKADDANNSIWDIDQVHSEEEARSLGQSLQSAKVAKKQTARVTKAEKSRARTQLHSDKAKVKKPRNAKAQSKRVHPVTVKPAPAALSQLRPRRIAAIKANKKIQGLDASDEIVDDEETVLVSFRSGRHRPLAAVKTSKDPKVRDAGGDRPESNTKLPTAKFSTKHAIPDSVSPDSSDKKGAGLVPNPKSNSSPEKVTLAGDTPTEALQVIAGEYRNKLQKENPPSTTVTSTVPLQSKHTHLSSQPDPFVKSIVTANEAGKTEVNLVPDSVPPIYECVFGTEPAPVRPPIDDNVKQRHDTLNAIDSVSLEGQDQIGRILPHIDDVSHGIDSNADRVGEEVAPPQAPATLMTIKNQQRMTSPNLAEAARKSLPGSTTARYDPFVAKLNASMPQKTDTTIKIKTSDIPGDTNVKSRGLETSKSPKLQKSSRESTAGATNAPSVILSDEAKQSEVPRRRLKSAMQAEGGDQSFSEQSREPAGDSSSALVFESKRKIEQVENMSNKRVRLAPRELLEGDSVRKNLAKNVRKTPPLVVSKKPLVIAFSSAGPRNQGTVSTKKSKPPHDAGTGVPDILKPRKREATNLTVNQVEVSFLSARDALEEPSENLQRDVINAGDIQNEAGAPSVRREVKRLNTVMIRPAEAQENQAMKRKLAPFVDDPAPWEHETLSKRRKRDIKTPSPAQTHHPKMLPDVSAILIYDRSQRLSSQNTRVNENGSPMPFLISGNEDTAADDHFSDGEDGKDALAEARLEEQLALQNDDPILPEPALPLPTFESAVSTSQPKATAYQTLSNNSKQAPSSPHAPSALGTMPPHHLYHDGKMVNTETKESIVPTKPQDPFLDVTQKPPNSFMKALRKSTELAAKRLVPGFKDRKDPSGVVTRQSICSGQDPDKTLVEPDLKRRHKREKKVQFSDSSSSTRSCSSTLELQPNESSEEESDVEENVRWRKQLEPHQENMLECLLTISHVRNDLKILLEGH